MPFADLYMEVEEIHRRQGFGRLILQELKRECYQAGRVPAARCWVLNKASKAALTKAGLRVFGFMMTGDVKTGQDALRPRRPIECPCRKAGFQYGATPMRRSQKPIDDRRLADLGPD